LAEKMRLGVAALLAVFVFLRLGSTLVNRGRQRAAVLAWLGGGAEQGEARAAEAGGF
jgi:hypothetical protein